MSEQSPTPQNPSGNRRGSAPYGAPPPKPAPEVLMMMLQDKLRIVEENHRKSKQELISYQQKCRSLETQLSSYHYKEETIHQNYTKIEQYQNEIDSLNKQVKYIQDKYDLLNQTKNMLSHDLSEHQQRAETLHVELEAKEDKISDMAEQIKKYQELQQKLIELEQTHTNLIGENNQLKEQYMDMKNTAQTQSQELKALGIQKQELDMENLLLKDNNDKLTSTNQVLQSQIEEMEKKMEREKSESEIALKTATRQQSVMIKELQNQLKVEANKNVQLRAEIYRMKDELDELRSWREQYLLQATKGQLKLAHHDTSNDQDNSATYNNDEDRMSSDSGRNSSNSSASGSASGKRILTKSTTNSHSHHLQDDPDHTSINNNKSKIDMEDKIRAQELEKERSKNKEHEEVIFSLSERLAVVKEENMILKNRLGNKNNAIEELQRDLNKKQEWIADLIEKLNEKPTILMSPSSSITMATSPTMTAPPIATSNILTNGNTNMVMNNGHPIPLSNTEMSSYTTMASTGNNLHHTRNEKPTSATPREFVSMSASMLDRPVPPKHKPPKARPPRTPMYTNNSKTNLIHRNSSRSLNNDMEGDTDSETEELGDVRIQS